MVADRQGTVTARTRALRDLQSDPGHDGPCWPTRRPGGSTLVLPLVDGAHRGPTIT